MNRRQRRLQATRERAESMGLRCDMCGQVAVQFVSDSRDFASFLGTKMSFTARCGKHPAPNEARYRTMSVDEFLTMKVQESLWHTRRSAR